MALDWEKRSISKLRILVRVVENLMFLAIFATNALLVDPQCQDEGVADAFEDPPGISRFLYYSVTTQKINGSRESRFGEDEAV